MGKKLIIRGADFSANAIEVQGSWLLGITDAQFNAQTNSTSWGAKNKYAFAEQLNVIPANSVVLGVKVKTHTTGNIYLYRGNFTSNTSKATNMTYIGTLIITEIDTIQTFMFDTPVLIGSGQCIVIGNPEQGQSAPVGAFYYGAGRNNLRLTTNNNVSWVVSTLPLGVDYLIEQN